MKENDVVLRTVTKLVVFILLTFGFYVFFAGHNNPGGGFIGGLIFSSAFILMIIGALVSSITAIIPMFFGKPFLSQYETTWLLPILGQIHVSTITLFELGILFSVVGVIVTVMLSLSGGRS